MRLPRALCLVLTCTALFFAGCGGGGGSSASGHLLKGRFLDGPFIGLRFETNSVQGITDDLGQFEYRSGERVRFYVGATYLGDAVGQPELTIFALRGLAPPETNSRIHTILQDPRSAFNPVCNTLQLLHTLDHDADPSNGFTISSPVDEYFDGVTLNLEGRWYAFRVDKSYREAVNALNDGAQFSDHRVVRPPWMVMQEEYSRLGIAHFVAFYADFGLDRDGDGLDDRRSLRTYSPSGVLLRRDEDKDANNTIDEVCLFVSDALGNWTRAARDADNNGSTDDLKLDTYDRDGNHVEQRTDSDGNGTFDAIRIWTYNSYGRVTRFERDTNGDGNPDWIAVYTYDALGRRVMTEIDQGGDNTVDNRRTYERNAHGDITEDAYDSDADGQPSEIIRYSYNELGDLVLRTDDRGALGGVPDGVPDTQTIYVRDALGRIVSLVDHEDADGVPDRIINFEYNEHGETARSEVDRGADGVINSIMNATFDARGRIVLREEDTNADGTSDRTSRYVYDEHGAVPLYEIDEDGDGDTDVRYTNSGDLISAWWTAMGDYGPGV